MASSPGPRSASRTDSSHRLLVIALIVMASLLAWTAWDNLSLREDIDALRRAARAPAAPTAAVVSAAPASAPSAALSVAAPSGPAAAAVPAKPAARDPFAAALAAASAASGPSLERALEALRQRGPDPRTSPFGSR